MKIGDLVYYKESVRVCASDYTEWYEGVGIIMDIFGWDGFEPQLHAIVDVLTGRGFVETFDIEDVEAIG